MGLINENVDIILVGRTIHYFENLGYDIPKVWEKDKKKYSVKKGTKLSVKISDLPLQSNINVSVKCDYCGRIYKVPYYNYTKHNYNGKCYCIHCASKVLTSGENHWNWNFDLSEDDRIDRRSLPGYNDFVRQVLTMANFTCQKCGIYGGELEAHHLNGYNWYKEGRIDSKNGICLCKQCHKNFHALYGNSNNTIEQFLNWINKPLNELQNSNNELIVAREVYWYEGDKIFKSCNECANYFNVYESNIRNICFSNDILNNKNRHQHQLKGNHFFWVDSFNNLNELNKFIILNNIMYKNLIVCITNHKIFKDCSTAGKFYNKTGENIRQALDKSNRYCGNENNIKLQWMKWSTYKQINNITDSEEVELLKTSFLLQ